MRVTDKGFAASTFVLLTLIIGAMTVVGVQVYRNQQNKQAKSSINSFEDCVAAGYPLMESFPEQCAANGQTFTNTKQQAQGEQEFNNGFNQRFESGQKGFSVIIPDGWTGLISAGDSDWIMLRGEKQPELKIGTKPHVETIETFGFDGPNVFGILLTKPGEDTYIPPNAEQKSVSFKINEGEPVDGVRYFTEHMSDTTGDGIGGRLKGDKDYYYVFNLKDSRYLIVHYSIYGSDPRNLVTTIEEVISTINIE